LYDSDVHLIDTLGEAVICLQAVWHTLHVCSIEVVRNSSDCRIPVQFFSLWQHNVQTKVCICGTLIVNFKQVRIKQ
jgi:hypothetical protein